MDRLYVLTRKDLGLAYGAVQAGHAVERWCLEHPNQGEHIFVYLVVADEAHLKMWQYKLSIQEYDYSMFFEPDINNELTAIACCTDTKIFSNLKKMGE